MTPNVFVDVLLRARLFVIAIVVAVSCVAGYFVTKVEFENSMDIWFLEDDPTLVSYQKFQERFTADEVSVVGVFMDNVFTPENLERLARITDAVEHVPFAYRVLSLTNTDIARADGDLVEIGPLMERIPKTQAEADAIRDEAMSHHVIKGGLVSNDGKSAAVVIELHPDGADFAGKIAQTQGLRAIAKQEKGEGVDIRIAGSPAFDEAFYRLSKRDFMIFGPVTLVVVVICCFVVFRRLSSTLIPLSIVALAILWTFGFMGAVGLKINVITTALLGLLLAVGIAGSIHILSDYYQHLMAGFDPETAVRRTVLHMFAPVFFTSMTTAAGMLSLTISNLAPVSEFGWIAALGVTVSFVLSIAFIPVVLRLAKPPDPEFVERQKGGPVSSLLVRLGAITPRRSAWVLVISTLVLVSIGTGLFRLDIGANAMNYFKETQPVRVDTEVIDRGLGGSATIEHLITTPEDGMKDPQTLRRIDEFSRWLEAQPGVSKSVSIVDLLKDLNQTFHEGDPAYFAAPDSRALAAQLYLLLEGEDEFDSFVQDNYSAARVTSRVQLSRADELMDNGDNVENELLTKYNDDELKIVSTGFLKLMGDMEHYVLQSQIESFSIAFVVITAMMGLLLRSAKLGLFSMIPNLSPILLGLAFMGIAGIELDPGTVMIGSICLGLVVDDTVHFLVRLRRYLKAGKTIEEGVAATMNEAGRPIIVTSVLLACGFLVLTLGSFQPNVYFGLISAIIIMFALAADLLVLPATLQIIRPRI
ncbi:MMPL family transporter [bacterium]|nr:MMPL family transporter [bacterium]